MLAWMHAGLYKRSSGDTADDVEEPKLVGLSRKHVIVDDPLAVPLDRE